MKKIKVCFRKKEMEKEVPQEEILHTKRKQMMKIMACMALLVVCMHVTSVPVFASQAASGDYSSITAPFDTLKGLVAAILSSIGYIVTLWGIGEWGISYQSSEGTMQAQAFKRIGGGFVMVMAPQILSLLV